jgi:hypothetical protein
VGLEALEGVTEELPRLTLDGLSALRRARKSSSDGIALHNRLGKLCR